MTTTVQLTELQRQVLGALHKEMRPLDEIAAAAGLDSKRTYTVLMGLKAKNLARRRLNSRPPMWSRV